MIPNNARTLRVAAAAGTELAGASFRGTVRAYGYWPYTDSSLSTVLYNPKAFITHTALLRQAFAIAQDSPLLPPVGVWTVSQFQCG